MFHPTDKCQSPFRPHRTWERVYAPYGVFGAQYRIESESQYKQLKSWTPPWWMLLNFWMTLSRFSRLPYTVSAYVSLLIGLALLGLYIGIVRSQTGKLMVAEPKPTFRFAVRQFAREAHLGLLWLGNIVSLVVAYSFVLIALPHHTIGIAEWILIGLWATVGLLFSYLIFLNQALPVTRASETNELCDGKLRVPAG